MYPVKQPNIPVGYQAAIRAKPFPQNIKKKHAFF
jgi:hypothetical protein